MRGAYSSKRNFLFDLDGTLVDSSSAHANAYIQALTPRHPNLAADFHYDRFAGQPTRQVFASLGLTEPEMGELTDHKQRLYRAALDSGAVVPFPGAVELMTRLCEENRRLFVVTGASRISAERVLDSTDMTKFFSGLIAAEDAGCGKPSAEPYLRALSVFGLAPSDCLAIEDGESGIRSACAAGLDAVLIHSDFKMDGVMNVRGWDDFGRLVSSE